MQDALLLESLGVEYIVLECIPGHLAQNITEQLSAKTIGIGAGVHTDGQILVSYDMLGITQGKLPKFVKNFGEHCGVLEATQNYIKEVQNQEFPSKEYSY